MKSGSISLLQLFDKYILLQTDGGTCAWVFGEDETSKRRELGRVLMSMHQHHMRSGNNDLHLWGLLGSKVNYKNENTDERRD